MKMDEERSDHILTDREIEEKYGRAYAELDLFPEDRKSQVIPALFSALGACIGVLPGCFLWIVISEYAFVVPFVGVVMAGGAFWCGKLASSMFGYKSFNVIQKAACVIVIAIAAYLSARYVIIIRMTDIIEGSVQDYRMQWAEQLEERGFTMSEISNIATQEKAKAVVCKEFGIKDISRRECHEHFSTLLNNCHMKKDYTEYILICNFIAFSGVILPGAQKRKRSKL